MKKHKSKYNNYSGYVYYMLGIALITFCFFILKKLFYDSSIPKDFTSHLNNPTKVVEKIDIEVQNGCGVNKIAEKYSVFLRDKKNGFDVVDWLNADRIYEKSMIIIHKNNIDKRVEELAIAMGIDKKQIMNTNGGIWDVTIIIGNDFKSISSYKELLIINSEMTNE